MAASLVTIAVVPRERFSATQASLESILTHKPPHDELIYIDGGSPPLVRQYLEQRAARHGFRLVSTECHIAPNTARNLAARLVRTRYVAFVDNDVLVSPRWLENLVECAEATGAWLVGPLCGVPSASGSRVVSCGGSIAIANYGSKRTFQESWPHRGSPLKQIQPELRRTAVDQVEFHACVMRMEAFDRLGPLDDSLLSGLCHTDLGLLVRQHSQTVYVEPNSVVTYVPPPPFESTDLPYFQRRWSEAWNVATVERFRSKWELSADDPGLALLAESMANHRRLTLEPYRRALRLFGQAPARLVEKLLIAPFEDAVNRRRFPQAEHDSLDRVRTAA